MNITGMAGNAVALATGSLSWLPWALAVGSLAVGAGGTLWYRDEWKDCQASAALDAARAQATVVAAKEADSHFARQLEEQLAPITRAIQDQANATQITLAKVPSNPSCAHTPAANAFDSSVRSNSQQAGAGAPRSTRP